MENKFSSRIRELRTSLKLTQSAFAKSIGTSQNALSGYENKDRIPSYDILVNIATTYNISLDWLCGLTETKEYSPKITTYAELIQLITEIVDISTLDTTFEIRDVYENPETLFSVATLNIDNKKIIEFFSEWKDVLQLCKKSPSGKKLYHIWLNDILIRYDIPISSEPSDREPELAFN